MLNKLYVKITIIYNLGYNTQINLKILLYFFIKENIVFKKIFYIYIMPIRLNRLFPVNNHMKRIVKAACPIMAKECILKAYKFLEEKGVSQDTISDIITDVLQTTLEEILGSLPNYIYSENKGYNVSARLLTEKILKGNNATDQDLQNFLNALTSAGNSAGIENKISQIRDSAIVLNDTGLINVMDKALSILGTYNEPKTSEEFIIGYNQVKNDIANASISINDPDLESELNSLVDSFKNYHDKTQEFKDVTPGNSGETVSEVVRIFAELISIANDAKEIGRRINNAINAKNEALLNQINGSNLLPSVNDSSEYNNHYLLSDTFYTNKLYYHFLITSSQINTNVTVQDFASTFFSLKSSDGFNKTVYVSFVKKSEYNFDVKIETQNSNIWKNSSDDNIINTLNIGIPSTETLYTLKFKFGVNINNKLYFKILQGTTTIAEIYTNDNTYNRFEILKSYL